ncbi:MAG: phosphodiester glycosidase family protein [Acidimicrobiales bacterium]
MLVRPRRLLAALSVGALTLSAGAASAAPVGARVHPPVCVVWSGHLRCTPWHPVDTWASVTSVLITSWRPWSSQSTIVATAAWFNARSTLLALYPGYKVPGPSALDRGPEMVPPSARRSLLATFNGGFYEVDAAGGFFAHQTLYAPMRRGLATVVRYRSGRVDVMTWTGGPRPPATVVLARQNLPLLVAAGRPTPASADNAAWGVTLYGAPAVWRSALGVDASGNLVYAAAPGLTSSMLAALMVQLHCVRAMELDINPEWPVLITYGGPGAAGATMQTPNPNQIPTRYLAVSTKDFFALYASRTPGAPQPW